MDLYKELKDETRHILDSCLAKLKQYKKIVLYGAGMSGSVISGWLIKHKVMPEAFIDSNPSKTGTFVNGIKVCSKEVLSKRFADAFIIVSCGDYAMILSELIGMGFSEEFTMYMDPKWITQPDGFRGFMMDHMDQFQEVYGLLEDERSKKVFLNMLKYKLSYHIDYIREICSEWKQRYFDAELFQDKIIRDYVDAGGYTGDTVEAFVNMFGGGYSHIYVFEPNKSNMRQLIQNVKTAGYHDVYTYTMGLYDQESDALFNNYSEIAGRIDEQGKIKIHCCRMDQILRGKQVAFIKLDVEGAELRALEGSKGIIKKNRPNLAVCVYHKPEDYFEIPLWIKQVYPGYKLYFRQYELSDTETICYAIGE